MSNILNNPVDRRRRLNVALTLKRRRVSTGKNLSIISLDFLKEIDRVDWDFIFSALQKFGYGDKFIYMIKVVYISIQSKNKINGFLSDSFTLMQAVRQGCPLSILLYIIAAEVLANFIDADKRIKGIHIGD